MRAAPLLEVQDLSVEVPAEHGAALAVDGASFVLEAGGSLGIVGESGCGKSLTCLAVMGLLPVQAAASGTVRLDGTDLLALPEHRLERVRGRDIAMVFQDPHGALNPVRTIGAQIAEPLVRHDGLSAAAALAEAGRLLDQVRMPAAARRLGEYPHQLSGGMCQRAMIAMAIACRPRVLIADEPTTALDVTVQAEILALLRELQRELGMALVIVTHDLGVVAHMARTVAVMYAGRIVERAPVRDLFARPMHPYTHALLDALPHRVRPGERLVAIPGAVPALTERPSGCAYRARCARAAPECASETPRLAAHGAAHAVACLRAPLAADAA